MKISDKIFSYIDGDLPAEEMSMIKRLIHDDYEWKRSYEAAQNLENTLKSISNPEVDPMVMVNMKLHLSLHGKVKPQTAFGSIQFTLLAVMIVGMVTTYFWIYGVDTSSSTIGLSDLMGSLVEVVDFSWLPWVGGAIFALMILAIVDRLLMSSKKQGLTSYCL